MADYKKELAAGKELKSSKAKTKLPDEMLAGIQGAGWTASNTIDVTEKWRNKMFDIWALWRSPGQPDRWCTIERYTYAGSQFTEFDLYCPTEGYLYYAIPASQVLLDTDV